MAGSGQCHELQLPYPHGVPVPHPRLVGAGRNVSGRSSGCRQATPPGDVVGVVVRLEHVADLSARVGGRLPILVDLPLRIDHRSFARSAMRYEAQPRSG